MSVNKVVLNGNTLIDLTSDSATESDVFSGITFHKANGNLTSGTYEKSGIDINGIIRQYQIEAGENISAGDFVEFISRVGNGLFAEGNISTISACKLDNNRVFIAYMDGYNYNYRTGIVLTLQQNIVKIGEPYVFSAHNSVYYRYMSAVALTENSVYIVSPSNDRQSIRHNVLAIDGDVISSGGVNVDVSYSSDISGDIEHAKLIKLSASKLAMLFVYADADEAEAGELYTSCGVCVVFGVRSRSITRRVEFGRNLRSSNYYDGLALTEDKMLLCCIEAPLSSTGSSVTQRGRVSIVNTTWLGDSGKESIYQIELLSTSITDSYTRLARLTPTKVVATGFGSSVDIMTIYGNVVSVEDGGSVQKEGTLVEAVSLDHKKVLLCYTTGVVLATIDGTNTTVGNFVNTSSKIDSLSSAVAMSENSVILTGIKGSQGVYAGLTIGDSSVTIDTGETGTFVKKATSSVCNGVAKTEGSEGDIIDVYCVV